MAFDSAGDLWVSHSEYTDLNTATADDWTGKISMLSGVNYSKVTTEVINLPRSVRDHMTNQMVFGPDGALYFAQAANTAMGAPDNAWGLRSEHLLNDAVLRLDISKLGTTPLDVKTDSGGTYNPYAPGAPLTIYATGVRNAYDLVWTSNGRLFAPTNGSAAGGNTPATPTAPYSFGANQRIDFSTNGAYVGPNVPAVINGPVQPDYIFNIVQGGYYGEPNPTRGEFVLNGGNPTSGVDPNEVPDYPDGTLPDRNYRGNITGAAAATMGSAYAYGYNYSPDGIIQYQGTAFGGALNGKLMVVDYSGGDDITVLGFDANGNITSRESGIAGLTGFTDPLDLTENTSNGFIYVAEYGGQQLTLVRPIIPGAQATASKAQMVFNDPTSAGSSPAQNITITNTGTTTLAFPSDGVQITGTDSTKFAITQKPPLPTSIAPGASITVSVTFTASTVGDIRTASLQIKSNDPNNPILNIPLRGLGTSGEGGTNEPSLQQVFNLYNIPDKDGDTTPLEVNLDSPPALPNDEVVMQSLVKAGDGPVTITPLDTFGVGSATVPTFRFGYYTPGNKNDQTELLTVTGVDNSQSVNPVINGTTTFDPGTGAFALYTYWQNFTATNRPTVYEEDALNIPYDSKSPRKLRFYPLKNPDGTVVPNAYIFAWEEFNSTYDNQDFVGIIRNVKAGPAGPEIGFENLDGAPSSTTLVFNRIQVQPPAKENANNNPTYQPPNNIVDDTSTLRIRNTGTSTLTISSLVLSSTTQWQLTNAPTGAFTIAPGGSQDITIKFIAQSGGMVDGTLTVNSNDADEPSSVIKLNGWWQNVNEGNPSAEPTLQQIITTFGYGTTIVGPGQLLNQGGKVARVGDEVLSPYWNVVDSTLPVSVRQLDQFHTQGNTATLFWYSKGSSSTTTLFTADGDEGQSFLPHTNVAAVGTVGTTFAAGTFSPTTAFGFKVDGEWSDDTKNVQEHPGGGWGHHVRFWVARDANGNIIPNTYFMAMDYSGINYDYNDNVYLVSNIKPFSGPSMPTGLTALPAGISLDWDDNTEANLAGYNVYRSTSATGTFSKLNSVIVTTSNYLDSSAAIGTTYFYEITAVDNAGNESAQTAAVSATRTSDNVPPAAPGSLVSTGDASGVHLDWASNTEADLAGYNVYRSNSAGGPFTKLNGALLSNSNYVDTTAPVGVTSFYQVTAVDTSSNESAPATTNAVRLSNDTTAPAAPSGLVATDTAGGIQLTWTANSENDLAGYNIYGASSLNGTYTKLNTSLLAAPSYLDAAAVVGTTFYHVTAVDTSSNESAFAATSASHAAASSAFTYSDIGSPTPAGSSVTVTPNKDFNVSAGGNDVYANSDTFGYLYQQVTGDFDFAVQLSALSNPSSLAKAGLMARETLAANSRNAFVYATPSTGGYRFTSRGTTGGSTTAAGSGTSTFPNDWLRMQRVGNVFNGYRSSDGVNWTLVSSVTLNVGQSIFVGMAAVSHTTTATVTAQFRNFTNLSVPVNTPPATPQNLVATTAAGGIQLTWTANTESDLQGYNIYRSSSAGGTYTKLNSSPISVAQYLDATAPGNQTSFYHVVAIDTANQESTVPAAASAAGPDTVPPGVPQNPLATSGVGKVTITWTADSDSDLAGYNVYRSATGTGGWTKINTSLITATQYVDSTAPGGKTSFYQITAVDTSTNESAASTIVAAIPAGDTTPPAQVQGLSASASAGGIQLTWTANTESDLAGYTVFYSPTGTGNWVQISNGVITATSLNDGNAPAGVASFYEVFAVDTSNNTSTAATTQATRPSTTATPIKINFTLAGTAATAGYDEDNGNIFGLRPDGLTYGWSKTHTSDSRQRTNNASKLLDGLVQMQANSSWSINVPNGSYTVKIDIGDAQYASNNTLHVNGVTYWTNLALNANQFSNMTQTVIVTNGKITLDNTGAPDRLTKINFIEITPSGTQPTPPATPTGLTAVGSASGIQLDWADSTDPSVVGYDVYRSADGSTNWTKLDTSGALTASQYLDTTAPAGATSFYQVVALNASNVASTPATASALRPAVAGAIKINFTLAGTAAISGYDEDNGNVFGLRPDGLTYGWSKTHTSDSRERTKNSNLLLDGLVQMQANSSWSINVANGTYTVKINIGDAQYTSDNTLNVNGMNYWTNLNLAADAFASMTQTITVTNGKITLDNTGAPDRLTKINYIEITPA